MATPQHPLDAAPKAAATTSVTHVIAAVLAAIAGFVVTPAGQALIHQYPILSVVSSLVLAVAAVYHDPKAV